MPWWIWIWIAILAYMSIGGVVKDLADRIIRWKIVADIIGDILKVLFIFAYFLEPINLAFGALVIPAVILAAIWEVVRCIEDIRKEPFDSELSRRTNIGIRVSSVIFTSALAFPAFVLGAIAGIRYL